MYAKQTSPESDRQREGICRGICRAHAKHECAMLPMVCQINHWLWYLLSSHLPSTLTTERLRWCQCYAAYTPSTLFADDNRVHNRVYYNFHNLFHSVTPRIKNQHFWMMAVVDGTNCLECIQLLPECIQSNAWGMIKDSIDSKNDSLRLWAIHWIYIQMAMVKYMRYSPPIESSILGLIFVWFFSWVFKCLFSWNLSWPDGNVSRCLWLYRGCIVRALILLQ